MYFNMSRLDMILVALRPHIFRQIERELLADIGERHILTKTQVKSFTPELRSKCVANWTRFLHASVDITTIDLYCVLEYPDPDEWFRSVHGICGVASIEKYIFLLRVLKYGAILRAEDTAFLIAFESYLEQGIIID
jgi:hypothetical protein